MRIFTLYALLATTVEKLVALLTFFRQVDTFFQLLWETQ